MNTMKDFSVFSKFDDHKLINPLFISKSKIDYDNEKLIQTLYEIKKNVKKGVEISNYNGYQTLPNLKQLEPFKSFASYLEDYISNKIDSNTQILSIWGNINDRNSFNLPHKHSTVGKNKDGIPIEVMGLSGVYYLKVPPKSGEIIFFDNNMFDFSYKVQPKESELVIFPAYMGHMVSPNSSEEDRISLAFNFISDNVTSTLD